MSVNILGIETSCDETAAAVVSRETDGPVILSNVVLRQEELHRAFGGVVPEIAARAHAEKVDVAVQMALDDAGLGLGDVSAVAVTAGPGLIGGLLAGVMCAKGVAVGTGLPLIGVNHLAGHVLTARLTDQVAYPYLCLLVSGGHCQFLIAHAHDRFERLGGTIDDAPGEAFDKTARVLGLPQPGGPSVEAEATKGNAARFAFPRPLKDRDDCNMSFSGLKTALVRETEKLVSDQDGLTIMDRADLAAGFQAAVRDILIDKAGRAIDRYLALGPTDPVIAVAGGVAANQKIRAGLLELADQKGVRFVAPPLDLCTDNGAMIGWAGLEMFEAGHRDDMTLAARPRWPLDTSQEPMLGSGKKGAKA